MNHKSPVGMNWGIDSGITAKRPEWQTVNRRKNGKLIAERKSMTAKSVDQSLQNHLGVPKLLKVCLGSLGVAMLVSTVLAAVSFNYLMPNLPGRALDLSTRISWYLQHGQLQADSRTLAAALQYVLAPAGESPNATNYAFPTVPVSQSPKRAKIVDSL